ncbi:hypothetical protein [Candidatus Blastococcus massiliensis]|uniref:hypothetical protein n=1 Tax=Candidatus Blastococcus massiliensis TaxID=1470358 RepID=UPI0004BB87A7|nr:hypothetical protein [Candidatus Blastococcus massiliensis]
MILDRDDVELTLPAAITVATKERRELCVAIVRPRPLWSMNAALCAALAEETDRQLTDLLELVRVKTARLAGEPRISVHLVAGLRGRRRQKVLDRLVGHLARHYDARPMGTWAA